MRYILIILVFLSVGANAQMVIKAHANYRPYASPAANLLLDDYPNAAAAYSLRKLDKDYAGSAIRVRRSNDNAESDIGFTSSGDLDTVGLKNFVGANDGFVVTWYDQSSNSKNAMQTTASRQGRIVSAGTIRRAMGKPSIEFTVGANSSLYIIPVLNTNVSDWSVFFAIDNVGNTNPRYLLDAQTGRFVLALRDAETSPFDNYAFFDGGASFKLSTTTTTSGKQLLSYLLGTNGQIYKDGVNILNTTYTQRAMAGTIGLGGAFNYGGSLFDGIMSECIIYNSYQSSNRTGIENNINDYYNIYWNGDFTGLLDTYGSSAAAYSLRNLSSTYTGPLIRVRRSNDNAEQDIFGDYYGNLDTAGLKNFVGANSGFVTTWYDQSGNGSNATQSTAANQPRIVNAGVIDRANTKPAVLYDGTNDRFETAIETMDLNSGDNVSGFTVIMPNNITSFRSIITKFDAPTSSANVEDGWGFRITSASKLNIFFGQNTLYSNTTSGPSNEVVNTQRLASFFANGGNLATNPEIFGNGTNITGSNTGTINTLDNTTYVIRLGALKYINVFYDHWSGTMQEIVLYNADKRTDRTGIEGNINTHYSIY